MIDFLMVSHRINKNGTTEIYPKFVIKDSQDLMIRGGDFYAIWREDIGLWSTKEKDALNIIDRELKAYADKYRERHPDATISILYMWDSENGMIDRWHRYCQKHMRDDFRMLDEKLIFSNTETTKKDYASKRLNYPLEPGDISAYEKIISTLYTEEERMKIEWAIGAIVTGHSKSIQKFMVLYGAAGTGKSTILNIIQKLFAGYYSVFDAKALGSSSSAFALEAFNTNPLVAIQHDGDLSRIEDNTRLNSLVSHELMTVNEKFKKQYSTDFKAFLFMGTNRPVKITDGKSGLIRRLIDVTPSGNKLSPREYKQAVKQVDFELGAIACHCRDVYLSNPGRYDDYIPIAMMGASNDFYNFVAESYYVFKREDGTTLKAAWEMYKTYCEEARVPEFSKLSRRLFQEELKNYFWEYNDRFTMEDNSRVRCYYKGFRKDKFEDTSRNEVEEEPKLPLLELDCDISLFDDERADCPAQYASDSGTPMKGWDYVKSTLADLDTSKLHYVKVPDNHIVIDFDIKDEQGNKSLEKNLEAASKWPATYAELSKSGAGVHLHYIYTGDPTKLSRVYDADIEIKVFTGKSSLRRRLTKCNDLPIATISSGLPLKGDKMISTEVIKSEIGLRKMIKRNLNKEIHPATKPSFDFIYKILEEFYARGEHYDVSDMYNALFTFAVNSTHQSDYCLKLLDKMKLKSDEPSKQVEESLEDELIFYDCEVFPNLFLVNWKVAGEGKPVVRMINPKPKDIEELLKFKLVGFNCRRYDNHMLYACLMGYTNEQLYQLSQKIISNKANVLFGEAYNISYTDVYDFCSKKQSLKKWEIELGIHHQELGLPWDKPVPEELWLKVAEYCDNDVIATEAVFNERKADFVARQILAELAGGSVNDTTNSLTTKIIFGNNRKPQTDFNYRDLSKPVFELDPGVEEFLKEVCPEMMAQRHGPAGSLLPYFPGYEYKAGKSSYRGVDDIGEGGRVSAKHGIWGNVALLDIASMHPHSMIAEVIFGVKFTKRFYEIVYGRVHIKHEAWDEVNKMLDGMLTPYIQKVLDGEMTSDDLANALKIAINSVYGLTAAKFDNAFRDLRNIDNIVAKRGALFMIDLEYEVEKRGYTVAHVKTDSIKIPDATPEIIQFVMEFGKKYGYTFEHEATYEKMCLVNNAVYIAKYQSVEWCQAHYGYIPSKQKKNAGKWTATGKQFQIPYVFKKLFSKEEIEFADLCEAKEVKTAMYLNRNEGLPDGEDNMIFIGRVGNFCPIKPGCGGGDLVRENTDKEGNVKYDSVVGAKDYRWLESDMVYSLNKRKDIDYSYYDKLVDDAVDAIKQFGDFEWFVSDDPYITPLWPETESDLPFDPDYVVNTRVY